MKSQEQILQRIKELKEADFFGFETGNLIEYLTYENAKPYLKEDCKESDWKPEQLTPLEKIKDYMSFAWEKANNCRGISASRSLSHMSAWLWLMGEDEFLEDLDIQNYRFYGKAKLVKICEKFGIDWKTLDNGDWVNDEEDDPIAAEKAMTK